jgi:uroporphyrinogen-III decarboxylase
LATSQGKNLTGDALLGDIPPSLLVGGSVEDVTDYVKELIDFFPDGGLIVDGSAVGLPVESKKENVMALCETVFEYGQYR